MDEAKKNGDGLEQLAREAAEGAHFEFNAAAWSAMEQKLDVPKKGFFWWKLWGGLGVVAVIVLLVIFWPEGKGQAEDASKASVEEKVLPSDEEKSSTDIEGENLTNDTEKAAQAGAVDNENGKNAGADAVTENGTPNQTTDSTLAKTEAEDPKSDANEVAKEPDQLNSTDKQVANTNPRSSTDSNSNSRTALSETNEEISESVQSEFKSASQLEQEKNNEENRVDNQRPTVSYFDPSQPIGSTDSIGNEIADLYEVGIETIAPRWVPSVYLFDQSLKPMTLDSSFYQTTDLDSLQAFKRWSFGVLVSLDMSATGLEGFTDPGTMIGLLAEYRLSRKWSLQSGLSYSVKNYSALGEEYDTSTWPGGRSDNLVSALARCLVIDIPINVRRYFQAKNGNQWFVSSGVSTYLMLREDYEYEYTRPSPNWSPTGQVRGENNHFFGIANFSVGYETPINNKLGLAIEPFMKLPLTGIGQGRVKFLSFGANVAIKLR